MLVIAAHRLDHLVADENEENIRHLVYAHGHQEEALVTQLCAWVVSLFQLVLDDLENCHPCENHDQHVKSDSHDLPNLLVVLYIERRLLCKEVANLKENYRLDKLRDYEEEVVDASREVKEVAEKHNELQQQNENQDRSLDLEADFKAFVRLQVLTEMVEK